MPGFDNIIGQKLPIGLLQTFLSNGTLPHALIFSGIEGIGKRTVARYTAMALNCHTDTSRANPCGQCDPCRKVLSDSHPDVLMIEPQGQYLRIDQIRRLLRTLAMKPYIALHRVVIIQNAQSMNKEAANALLKVLEEPPAATTLILTASGKFDLLPTIVSRCRDIRFDPLSTKGIISLLSETDGIDTLFIKTAAALANGSLTRAKELATASWRRKRNWLIESAGLKMQADNRQRSIVSALSFAAQLAQRKDQVAELLELLITWIRDLSIWPYHPASVINGDCRDVLARVRDGMDDRRLLTIWQAVEKAQKDIAANANLRLTLDVMALSMAGYGPN